MLKTPLKTARGLGSAKDGTHHWIVQRITAVALVPLVIWFVYNIALGSTLDYASFVTWVARPWNAVLLVAFLSAGFYHSTLGVQVVIEDYVGDGFAKVCALLGSMLLHAVLGIAAVFSVLKIAFGA